MDRGVDRNVGKIESELDTHNVITSRGVNPGCETMGNGQMAQSVQSRVTGRSVIIEVIILKFVRRRARDASERMHRRWSANECEELASLEGHTIADDDEFSPNLIE